MPVFFLDSIRDQVAEDVKDRLNAALGSSSALQFFDGIMPASVSDPDSGTHLVDCALNSTPFAWSSGPTITANAITPGTAFDDGDLSYWRAKDGGGTTQFQGSCSTVPGDSIVFNTSTVVNGNTVTISSFVFTVVLEGT